MMLRSFLFVPADNERKIARGLQSEADALILDLEDSVAPDRKEEARKRLAGHLTNLGGNIGPKLYVRVNPLDSSHALDDLLAATHIMVAGIVLPKACGRQDIDRCGHYLDMAERAQGIAPGAIGILPVVTETAAAVLRLPELATPIGRLQAMTWGGEDLATVLGARGNKRSSGEWDDSFRLARALALLAAAACDVPAIDTLHADFRDDEGLRAAALSARYAGFSGKIAIHPDQVAIINEIFAPSETEIEDARAVVAAFAASPGSGVVGLGGRMLDRPHLVAAQRLLTITGVAIQS
ncbi:HpcH/HpaI aldolase/citrate lyase family protein [Sphingobium sp. CAP-1]|uniref:HpcH/HpaI aldolase/citrate lyase family protein n=1 Tax=Sphingobium sp. CAP-1 TaxID=2676077 RepID=UPI0012BB362F|nr:CoA ester lyase [Sphingobium sp. CAP-1]QGP80490.1 CoA ester lyase [Sphingobium sp. CAP-1]